MQFSNTRAELSGAPLLPRRKGPGVIVIYIYCTFVHVVGASTYVLCPLELFQRKERRWPWSRLVFMTSTPDPPDPLRYVYKMFSSKLKNAFFNRLHP